MGIPTVGSYIAFSGAAKLKLVALPKGSSFLVLTAPLRWPLVGLLLGERRSSSGVALFEDPWCSAPGRSGGAGRARRSHAPPVPSPRRPKCYRAGPPSVASPARLIGWVAS